MAWRSNREDKPTDYLSPAEGVPTEIGACGLLASSPRPHAAALYHEWWMGPEGQALLVKGGKYSSRTDVAPPEGSTPLSRSEEHTSELQSLRHLVCRLLLEKKKKYNN